MLFRSHRGEKRRKMESMEVNTAANAPAEMFPESNGTVQLLRAVISIAMFNLPYVAFMGVYLYRLDPILVLSLLFIFSPMVCAQVIKRKAYRRLTDETAALEREYRHYSDCMIDKRYWKETRTLGAVGFFMERFRAVLAKYDKKLWETDSRLYRTELSLPLSLSSAIQQPSEAPLTWPSSAANPFCRQNSR